MVTGFILAFLVLTQVTQSKSAINSMQTVRKIW